MGTKQKEVLVAESRPFASYGRMTTLKIHTKSALFGAGLVVLVGVLSAQAINNRFVAVRVLETPVIKTDAVWPPHPKDLFSEQFSIIGQCNWTDVYTVPNDKWLVFQGYDGYQLGYMRPSDASYDWIPKCFDYDNTALLPIGAGPNGLSLPPGTVLALYGSGSSCNAATWVFGYLVDA